MTRRTHTLIVTFALVLGAGLFALALRHADFRAFGDLSWKVGAAMPLLFLPSGVWHLLRTVAWRRCFPADARPGLARLFRVRLAAEAFSFATIRGLAGEPLKVVLLVPAIAPAVAISTVALERLAYLVVTTIIVGVAATLAIMTLPLSPEWLKVFSWLAAAALVLLAGVVALLIRYRATTGFSTGRGVAEKKEARVWRRVAAELDVLVRDGRLLSTLVLLEAAAFVMMALEVWLVLQVTGTALSALGAFTIETFTRVASVMSAFIPANLGALEASNVAAATAVHAAGGAAGLAVVRRLRGLVWCGAGFLVYPRGGSSRSREPARPPADTLVVMERPDSEALASSHLGGLPIAERILRAACRAGYQRLLIWAPSKNGLAWTTQVPAEVIVVREAHEWRLQLSGINRDARLTVVAPGVVPSPGLLERAKESRAHGIVEVPAGSEWPTSGVFRAPVDDLLDPRVLASRLARPPGAQPSGAEVARGDALLSMFVATHNDLAVAERRLRDSIFKPTDGRLGRFNRRASIPISVFLIRWLRLSPHAMSAFITLLGLWAGWILSRGDYVSGLAGAFVSLGASVLDGCDGELARLQYKESSFGCWLDTIGDYTYYAAVFGGLTVGAARQTAWPGVWWIGLVFGAGTLLTLLLLILLRWRITDGRPERLRTTAKAHFYGRGRKWMWIVAKLSTCATRATMPYGIVGFAVLGLLPAVVVLGAVGAQIYWISLALELRRLLNGSSGYPRSSAKPAY